MADTMSSAAQASMCSTAGMTGETSQMATPSSSTPKNCLTEFIHPPTLGNEEWRDAVDGDDADRDKLHAAWIDEVLRTALEADDQLLKAGKDVLASIVELPEHDTTI